MTESGNHRLIRFFRRLITPPHNNAPYTNREPNILMGKLPERNPFEIGKPVDFIERPELQPAIDSLLEGKTRKILIHAPPRSGGTTAAAYVLEQLRTKYGAELKEIFQIFVGHKITITNIEDEFQEELKATHYQKNQPLVIVLDEIESLERVEQNDGLKREEIIDFLLKKLNQNPNFYLIIVNRDNPENNEELNRFFRTHFSQEETVFLQLLSDDQIRMFFQKKLPNVSQEVIDWLVQQSGGQPALAQVIGFHVYDLIKANPMSKPAELETQLKNKLIPFFETFVANYGNIYISNPPSFYKSSIPRDSASLFWDWVKRQRPKKPAEV